MTDTLATRIEALLAAVAAQLITLVETVRALAGAVDRLSGRVDKLEDVVAPVIGDAAARASFGARMIQLVRQMKLANAIATAVLLLSLALSLPVFLSGLALAITDPRELLTTVLHLVDSARGTDVHPPQTPQDAP